jgi:uncharacterized protein YdhG (YjbR/CyaY superfamily)
MKIPVKDIDSYIDMQPENFRIALQKIRETIQESAPEAEEIISYSMPAFRYHGILVYFAGFKNHIGFFPTASGISAFKDELSGYELSKGTIRLPISKPIPYKLISKIVKFRVAENMAKVEAKIKVKVKVKVKKKE